MTKVEIGAIRVELRPSGNLEIAVTNESTAYAVDGMPVLRVQRADVGDLVRALGDALHTPFAGALGERAQRTIPGSPRTERERALLQRAFDLAGAAAQKLPPDVDDAPDCEGLDDATIAAYGVLILASDMAACMRTPPDTSRCAWCMEAAAGDESAMLEIPLRTMAEAREHTLQCEHNPLVRRVATLESELTAAERDRRTVIERANETSDNVRALLDAYVEQGPATWKRAWDNLTLWHGRALEPWSNAPAIEDRDWQLFCAGFAARSMYTETESDEQLLASEIVRDEYEEWREKWMRGMRDHAMLRVAKEQTLGAVLPVTDWRNIPPRDFHQVVGSRVPCIVCGIGVDVQVYCKDHMLEASSMPSKWLVEARQRVGRTLANLTDNVAPAAQLELYDAVIAAVFKA